MTTHTPEPQGPHARLLPNGGGMITLTAHDVRRLHVCCLCDEVGLYQPSRASDRAAESDMPMVLCIHSDKNRLTTVPKNRRSFAHPRCYIRMMGVAKLLGLHNDELGEIRMGDVTPSTFKRLLRARQDVTP